MTRAPFRLTREQFDLLIQPLHQSRVGRNPKGFSHLEAWDVRRWLIRVFGFGGFDIETVALDLVKEIENPPGSIKYRNGGSNEKAVWTVVYRAQVRLTIRDQFGGYVVLEDGACGDSTNQPSLGDCHDNAAKTALSQALKRCAVNLGDQFGLSLYNGGAADPVVLRCVVAPETPDTDRPTAAPLAVDDAPVRPEPGTEPQPADDHQAAPEPPAPASRPVSAPPHANRPVSGPPQQTPTAEMVAPEQHRHMHALWRELGYGGEPNRANRLQITAAILRLPDLDSSANLTRAQADTVIAALRERKRQMERQNQEGQVAA